MNIYVGQQEATVAKHREALLQHKETWQPLLYNYLFYMAPPSVEFLYMATPSAEFPYMASPSVESVYMASPIIIIIRIVMYHIDNNHNNDTSSPTTNNNDNNTNNNNNNNHVMYDNEEALREQAEAHGRELLERDARRYK